MSIKKIELLRTSQSWDGVELPDYPSGRPELSVVRLVFPVGAKTSWHHHDVINYGIVEQGELTIVCSNGAEKTFRAGEAIVEVVGTIHRGENRGNAPVVLDMFYVGKEGMAHTEDAALQPGDASKFANDAHEALNDEVKAGKRPKPANKAEERVFRLVLALGKQVLPRRQLVAEIGMRQNSRHTFSNNYIRPAYDNGYIDFSYPSSPHKPEQAYRLTSKGLELYAALTSKEVIC